MLPLFYNYTTNSKLTLQKNYLNKKHLSGGKIHCSFLCSMQNKTTYLSLPGKCPWFLLAVIGILMTMPNDIQCWWERGWLGWLGKVLLHTPFQMYTPDVNTNPKKIHGLRKAHTTTFKYLYFKLINLLLELYPENSYTKS